MRSKFSLLLLAGVLGCDLNSPAEVVNDPRDFPARANWTATLNPVGTAAVRGTLAIEEFLASRMEANASLTGGAASTAYQWRIFRGDCSVTTAAAANTSATGLLLFATVQSYPDLTTSAAGAASLNRTIAGALDSLTAYSVRVRLAQAATNWNGTSPLACGNLVRS